MHRNNVSENKTSHDEDSGLRLGWLMFFRVIIVSFLLGIAAFIEFQGTASLSHTSLYSVYFIIGITYFLSIVYALISKKIKSVSININLQSLFDVLLITFLVYVTGGIESIYATLYPLVIIYSVVFLGIRGGIIIASASGICYGIVLDLEFHHVIQPLHNVIRRYDFSAGYVFSRIFIYFVSFYIIAFIASFLVEREKKTRRLLSEREDAFEQLDALHRSIIESVDTGIMTIDLNDTIKSFNRAAQEITGYRLVEVKDLHIDARFPDMFKNLLSVMEGVNRFEYRLQQDDGTSKMLGFSVSPLRDDAGNGIGKILIFQDLTLIKAMESEIEKSKRLALIGEMSAVLAHELRTPLASISGSIQLLMNDLELNGSDERLMRIILRGKDQLENLVKDFLLLARPSADKHAVIDVREIIDEAVESVQLGPDWHDGIRLKVNMRGHPRIYGHTTEIRQVFQNILVNSLQAMPDGGELNIATDASDTGDDDNLLRIDIGDTGCGIAPGQLEQVREPFYTTKEKGTGLGLAIVNRVIESHGGLFRIESEPDKGVRCRVLLPRYAEKET